MGNVTNKDGTAQGVAKVRHWESCFPPTQRLYNDPYAYAMFPGSTIQQWMGPTFVDRCYRWIGLGGFSEMISVRTRWLDDQILNYVAGDNSNDEGGGENMNKSMRQLVILGAGYDTRGFRLDLWKDESNKVDDDDEDDEFIVLEVDQPEVQEKKLLILQWIIKKDTKHGPTISHRMDSKRVQFLPVNFNTDDLEQKLASQMGFITGGSSVITMEGVTQYIPKENSADTLKKLKRIIAPGSILLITYVDKKCFADKEPPKDDGESWIFPKAIRMVRDMADRGGEPWISGWTVLEFEEFLKDCGYQVLSDATQEDYNETYLKDVGRQLEEQDLLSMERFVVAKVL